MRTVFDERLLVVGGERAQRMLNAGAELRSTSLGTSVGNWVQKNTPTPLDRISFTVCSTCSRNAFDASVEQQMGLVEEEHQLRLVDVTHLGQRREEIRQHPHQERREHHRPRRLLAELEQRDDAAALVVERIRALWLQLGLAEERVGTLGL